MLIVFTYVALLQTEGNVQSVPFDLPSREIPRVRGGRDRSESVPVVAENNSGREHVCRSSLLNATDCRHRSIVVGTQANAFAGDNLIFCDDM